MSSEKTSRDHKKKLVVIGGGAAGFFCAITAARLSPGIEITILERSNKLLSKVRISGGGRCNVTHSCFEIAEMIKKYPRGMNFVKKAFHQFFTNDTIQWFKERGVELKTEADGRMFPVTDNSQTIIDCLLREVNKFKVQIMMNADVESIADNSDDFEIKLKDSRKLAADFVCIATGGYPKTSMFDWIKQIGHSIEEPVPSLFTFNMPGHSITKLMGVSVGKARVKINETKLQQEGPLLITHWGLSGPAILKLSAWAARELKDRNWNFNISVNWLPDFNENSLMQKFQELRFELAGNKLNSKNPFELPQRLWEFLLAEAGLQVEKRWADMNLKEQNKLVQILVASNFEIKGKTTFKEEFVTAGGIVLSEVDPNTMMSKKIPSLFFAGEVLNVDGITGGFNFQHAWTSGFIAGKQIALLAGANE